ncbi:SDR family oxidoreductase [Nafulsella turpanensis]|uniref:SDR family oxidoreductase n=1 Tax=Nafulsella turpanensis TaxID=1265690 RepID=UPI00034D7A2F|nr:SDR family oxidoreductase [Nafulsella turpanensis]
MTVTEKHTQSINKKVALVTGGSGGIGYAIACQLAGAGAHVVIADIKAPAAENKGILYKETDVTKAESVAELFSFMHGRGMMPDIIISNAGRGIGEQLAEGDPEKWQEIFQLNVMGHLRTIRSFLPLMQEKGSTRDIIFISSVAARKAYPWGGVYAASKAALQTIAETLRLEVQPTIRVSSILPGAVDTAFFENSMGSSQTVDEMGWGALQAEDVADAVLYILTRPATVAINEMTIRPTAQPF